MTSTSSLTSVTQTVNTLPESMEMIAYQDVVEALDKWTIPHVKPEKIYKIGTLDFYSKRIIKTFEHAIPLTNNDETLYLLHLHDLYPYLQKYKYVNIGLVQIAIKPLTLLGQDTSIQCTLRDGRCLNWKASLMGAIETSLSHGPVYFDIYPNLNIALSDANLSKVLELRILSKGYDYLPGSAPFAILYRIHLKVLTTLNPYTRKQTENGYTIIMDTNLLNSNSQVAIPRMIPWEKINFPTHWQIPNAVPVKPTIIQNLEEVIQTKDGNVYLEFKKPLTRSISNTSYRSPSYKVDLPESSRQSINEPLEFMSRPSSNESEINITEKLKGLHISENQIPHGIYTSRPMSPTTSDMNFNV